MLKDKVCWVLALALIDSLWVKALPSLTVFDRNAIYNRGRFGALGCPENEFFNDEGKACEPTCEDPFRSDVCKEKKVITCECDDGYVRNTTGACIRPEKCLYQLSPKSENTLSESGSKHSEAIIKVFESRAIDLHSNDTVNEATMSESEVDDLENTDPVRSELELDPELLEYLSNAHNEYNRQHIIEHQPNQWNEKDKAEVKIYGNIHELDNIDYSSDADSSVNLDDWIPTVFK